MGGFLYVEITVDACRNETRKQAVEGLVVVNSDGLFPCLVVLIDVDLGEEGLIEEPPGAVIPSSLILDTISFLVSVSVINPFAIINVSPNFLIKVL